MDYKIKSKKIQSENTVEPVETLSKLIAWGGGLFPNRSRKTLKKTTKICRT